MTTGEKIKYFRNMRGISQETLGQLSGINSATIKKYEYGIRNPKPDQLLKIANALGISINIFMDFDIETVSDVLSLLFKLDDQIDMKFEADKDDEGDFKSFPCFIKQFMIKLSFKNNLINKKLCTYMKALEIRENMLKAKDDYSEEEYPDSLQHINENIEEIKQHLLDDNMVVKKGTDRLTVKNYLISAARPTPSPLTAIRAAKITAVTLTHFCCIVYISLFHKLVCIVKKPLSNFFCIFLTLADGGNVCLNFRLCA